MEENEKREIEIVAQIKASVETINKCLVELDAMHATMEIEQPSEEQPKADEERQEVGPKDEQEAEQIDDAENVASETTEEKEDADNEKKYRY